MPVQQLTTEQAVILSAYTGVLCTSFSHFHAYAERLAGRPILTHEFGDPKVAEELKELSAPDFQALCGNTKDVSE